MNIILVANTLARPKVLTIWHIIAFALILVLLTVTMTMAFLLPSSGQGAINSVMPSKLYFRLHNPEAHLDALALQLGEIQARVMRLDALSDRLSKLAGLKDKDLELDKVPGRGGPEILSHQTTEKELQTNITNLVSQIDNRTDKLSAIEAILLQQRTQKNELPTGYPVNGAYNSSSYGWRVDPFTGRTAFHEGLDFTADVGTPIYASADGIVTSAEQTPDYGKIIKIYHGSGIETRYAHASELLVKEGDRVVRGQKIALVGSTGRSTGAHLHFEVRLNGEALDPRKYLRNLEIDKINS